MFLLTVVSEHQLHLCLMNQILAEPESKLDRSMQAVDIMSQEN